jgi:hypothetical protein
MPESSELLTKEAFRSFKHPLQPRRFSLALFFALILFPLIGAGLVAGTVVLLVPLFALLIWVGHRVFYATFLGNSILVSELNYARIHRIGGDLKTRIGYKKKIDIFVYEEGHFNAFLIKFFFYRRAVFLNSELLEAGVTDDELRWLIGRFVGYLRARREAGFWGWTIRAAQHLVIFNFFLLPYERALVYTGDRIALGIIAGDISSAVSAMQKCFVGRQLGYTVNPGGIVDQHRLVKGSFFALLARLSIAFPHMTARYVDLIGFAKKRYPDHFQRFDAANPGLPDDLERLTALPNAAPVSVGDPVFLPIVLAGTVLALLTVFVVKVVVPRLHPPEPSYNFDQTVTPQSDTTPSTSTPPQAPPDTSTAAPPPDASTTAPPPDTSADQQALVDQQKFTWSWDVADGSVQMLKGTWTNGSTQAIQSAVLQCVQYAQDGTVLKQDSITLTKTGGAAIDAGQTVVFGTFSAGDASQGVDKVACKIVSVTPAP